MSDVVTLSADFQIALPADMCAKRGWKPGQSFAFLLKETGVLFMPVPQRDDLAGMAKGADPIGYRDRKDRF